MSTMLESLKPALVTILESAAGEGMNQTLAIFA